MFPYKIQQVQQVKLFSAWCMENLLREPISYNVSSSLMNMFFTCSKLRTTKMKVLVTENH